MDEYLRLIEVGILNDGERLELLEGHLVEKMTRNPPHDGTVYDLNRLLEAVVPKGWIVRGQLAATLPDSVPEPDGAVVREDPGRYRKRHPSAPDFGIVIEVADSSLASDRSDKGRIYARAGIPVYWIVNLQDGWVEVYTRPSGPAAAPAYGHRQDYHAGDAVPVELDGRVVASVAVNDFIL